jgi:hypothetical protein
MMFWKMSIDLSRPLVPSMGHETPAKKALQRELLAAALEGLSHYVQERKLERPASQRLAFRELGLAIGLSAVELMASSVDASRGHDNHLRTLLEPLRLRGELAAQIRSFWLDPEHRRSATWSEQRPGDSLIPAREQSECRRSSRGMSHEAISRAFLVNEAKGNTR